LPVSRIPGKIKVYKGATQIITNYIKNKLSHCEIWCEGKLLLKMYVLVMTSFCNMVEVLTPYAHHLVVQALTR
jgi:hypothetical protein